MMMKRRRRRSIGLLQVVRVGLNMQGIAWFISKF
jgi:hypothetical protein